MDSQTLLLIALATLGAALLLGLLLFGLAVVVWPTVARRRALRAQAREDYLNARGTAHRELLAETLRQVESRTSDVERRLQMVQKRKAAQATQQTYELNEAYARYMVANHFRDIQGIGGRLEQQIISTVFRGKLSDLHQAHVVSGVGGVRQYAISSWVVDCEARRPGAIKGGFPGSVEIINRYQSEILASDAQIEKLTAELAELRPRRTALQQGLALLDGVSEKDFLTVLRDPERPSDRVQTYLRGAYAEWEPMPDWFRKAVEA